MTQEEKETIINFNKADKDAEVYTMEPRIIRRLQQLAIDRPEECKLIETCKQGSETYSIPKKWVKINPPRVLSDATREALRQAQKFGQRAGIEPSAEQGKLVGGAIAPTQDDSEKNAAGAEAEEAKWASARTSQ